MLVTVTPNPSIDLLFEAEELVWDDANRVAPGRSRPGGQGINVVRAARALGLEARAVAPLGGMVGEQLRAMLDAEGTPVTAVEVRAETRLFVGVRETGTGRNLLLNPRGRELTGAEADALAEATLAALTGARWLACCGSLPPGLPEDYYARLGRAAQKRGVRFVPDCDGMGLRLAARYGCDLLVPNSHEAERLLRRPVNSFAAAKGAARSLLEFGPTWAAITMGARGAVCATANGVWRAMPPAIAAEGSAVGAGDAFLAAAILSLEDGADAPDVLRHAVAAGTAALLGTGTDLIRREDVDRLLQDVEAVPL